MSQARAPGPEPSRRVRELFDRAWSLDPAARGEFVRRAAAGDAALADEVLALLQAHGDSARLRAPLDHGGGPPPSAIGPYKILDLLGEGGMGTVYLAEQREPVQRRVALKVIKLGMDSKAVLARFAQERQALALMQHDGIAKVHDAGMTERGQPYFVMEYVKGTPLNAWCDRNRIALRARIELMQQVCAAVTHAHQKGVVHRDLKPGNVLVTEDGGKVQIKIIDFGLAKAMGQKLVEATLFTEAGQIIGTPEYMAPEQADPTNQDIDTRADVYSLGVMLYELLVGALPFPQHELRAAGMLEVQRILREVDPPKPSTKLTASGALAEDVARARRTAVAALRRTLRSDLDWLVLKALEKDRARRYEGANALAADLQRFLDHEPLAAGPPSAAYRLRKLLRRYRSQVVAAAAVVATAIAGAVVAIGFAAQAKSSESVALARKAEFDQLAGVVLYERAVAAEQELYPPWPAKIAALERWLGEDCGRLLAMRPAIERTVADLRARALPWSEAEKKQDRETHPRFAEGQRAGQRLASLRRAQAIRAGAPLDVPALSAEQQALDANALNALAWDRVAPKAEAREVYGEEALALACARAAVAKAGDGDRFELLDTLAWALVANGQDEEARQRSAEALAAAPAAQKSSYEGHQRDVEQAIANAAALLAEAEAAHASLTADLDTRRTWTFADEAPRFLHDTLSELLGKLARLESNEKAAVEQRLAWARRIEDVSIVRHRARWDEARAAIRSSDKYRDVPIDLRPQIGLVPIGENPVTGLWEFYELRSAWDGTTDAAAIAIPAHRADGSIEVTGETGIVFVLLPGGTFTMGAQKSDPDGANHDRGALNDESPVHPVTLAPFFLARHELTRAQWRRLAGEQLTAWKEGVSYNGDRIAIGPTHPADSMDWDEADRWLRRHGLELPTEAQWEYGCRAGTTTVFWPGGEAKDLQDCANVHDRTSYERYPQWGEPAPITDGFRAIAPVASFRANAFGLYDVHGNVWEWCRDWYGSYGTEAREGDGYRLVGSPSGDRVYRGGCYDLVPSLARSAGRAGTHLRSAAATWACAPPGHHGCRLHDVTASRRPPGEAGGRASGGLESPRKKARLLPIGGCRGREAGSGQSAMRAKVFTLRFSPTLSGFDDSCLQDFVRDKEVLSMQQQLFVVHETPHLLCIVSWQEQPVWAAVLQEKPASRNALAQLDGIGPAKVERYGEALLAVLHGRTEARPEPAPAAALETDIRPRWPMAARRSLLLRDSTGPPSIRRTVQTGRKRCHTPCEGSTAPPGSR
jgi:serine/threonine protein kinase/formylglycine-generating enzyme required for sulfatase activity